MKPFPAKKPKNMPQDLWRWIMLDRALALWDNKLGVNAAAFASKHGVTVRLIKLNLQVVREWGCETKKSLLDVDGVFEHFHRYKRGVIPLFTCNLRPKRKAAKGRGTIGALT